jgi:hypothetical protein
MSECSPLTCMLVCANCATLGTRDRGCSAHPAFPAPSLRERDNEIPKLGRRPRRESEHTCFHVIASEAKQSIYRRAAQWIASSQALLATTVMDWLTVMDCLRIGNKTRRCDDSALNMSRERAHVFLRHCERSDLSAVARRAKAEAIHLSACRAMDCFVASLLAMTEAGKCANYPISKAPAARSL